jgi:hypothetical protein
VGVYLTRIDDYTNQRLPMGVGCTPIQVDFLVEEALGWAKFLEKAYVKE